MNIESFRGAKPLFPKPSPSPLIEGEGDKGGEVDEQAGNFTQRV
jgi:hypothetical protein